VYCGLDFNALVVLPGARQTDLPHQRDVHLQNAAALHLPAHCPLPHYAFSCW
jgi:hypothetical protein